MPTLEETLVEIVRLKNKRLQQDLRDQQEQRLAAQRKEKQLQQGRLDWSSLLTKVDQLQPLFDKIDILYKKKQPRLVRKAKLNQQVLQWGTREGRIACTADGYVQNSPGLPYPLRDYGGQPPYNLLRALTTLMAAWYAAAVCTATDDQGYLRCTVCGDKSLLAAEGEDVCPDCKRKCNE